ncbi:MAG: EAL domain-containing protein [Pseudomonadota bacterium]
MRKLSKVLLGGFCRAGVRAVRLCRAGRGLFVGVLASLLLVAPVNALEPIDLKTSTEQRDITFLGELIEGRGDQLQIETAPGQDGFTGRMAVRALTSGTDPSWAVFAFRNPTEKAIERWVVAPRYGIVGSQVLLPNLDSRRIARITPSVGFVPERVANDRADIFRVSVGPGQTITYVAELSGDQYPQIQLWNPLIYQKKQRDEMLFNGIMLGIVGLLAIFLTAIFAANHKAIFPAAAMVAWSVLAYLCIDFGFWHKLFQVTPEDNAFYRSAAEAGVAATLVIFLYSFLRIGAWHGWIRIVFGVWILGQMALIVAAFFDPSFAASFARASFGLIALLGTLPILYLALRGQDRALSFVPTWMLFCVWLFGAAVAVNGQLTGEIVVPGLTAGLVLVILLLGFTVTQFAFRSNEPSYGTSPTTMQLRSLAVDGAGSGVWEWNSRRDEISVGQRMEEIVGLEAGALSGSVDNWVANMHPGDRERFRLILWSVQEKNDGHIHTDFRMRCSDNAYRWFELEASAVVNMENRSPRCVGLIRDVTEARRAQERLIHDAVHDSLTGLPSRELFLDRLAVAMATARSDANVRPTVLFIDIDRFKNVNNAFGLIVGDTMLMTMARRLRRHLSEQDTLARVGGDQFAILLNQRAQGADVAMAAERVRRSLRSPMKIGGKEIILTGSIGIAVFDGYQDGAPEMMREAELAMYRAKRAGTDRIELFKASMRSEKDDRVALESDLRRALERNEIQIFYQPIVRLATAELAGFEALIRWEHPSLGQLDPSEFVPIAEESDLINALGKHVLQQAVQDAAVWQKKLPRTVDPLFVSVNISSRELLRQNLAQEVRAILRQQLIEDGCLRLEVTESLVMENPERAAEILSWLKEAGAGLSLDDFGTGYSSLAYLQRFPFDTLKIDRTLVQDESADERGSVIVRSVIAMAHELDRTVVAEGVETPETAAFLRDQGCDLAQGFFYGEPATQREVLDLLKIVRRSERNPERRGFRFWRKGREEKGAQDTRRASDGGKQTGTLRPRAPVQGTPPAPAPATTSGAGQTPGAGMAASGARPAASAAQNGHGGQTGNGVSQAPSAQPGVPGQTVTGAQSGLPNQPLPSGHAGAAGGNGQSGQASSAVHGAGGGYSGNGGGQTGASQVSQTGHGGQISQGVQGVHGVQGGQNSQGGQFAQTAAPASAQPASSVSVASQPIGQRSAPASPYVAHGGAHQVPPGGEGGANGNLGAAAGEPQSQRDDGAGPATGTTTAHLTEQQRLESERRMRQMIAARDAAQGSQDR